LIHSDNYICVYAPLQLSHRGVLPRGCWAWGVLPRGCSRVIPLDFIHDNPSAYQDEITEFFLSEFGIVVSQPTVSRLIKRLNHIYKRGERIHVARDDELRAHFRSKMCEYRANQLVFVDKSSADERKKDRRWGWSLKGLPCRLRMPGKRSTRWSILPAMGINGYIDYRIIVGGFNAEKFNLFIR
jgi:hypothetical protein